MRNKKAKTILTKCLNDIKNMSQEEFEKRILFDTNCESTSGLFEVKVNKSKTGLFDKESIILKD